MKDILDLERFPIHRLGDDDGRALLERCRNDLEQEGMFNLSRFVRADVVDRAAAELAPRFDTQAFAHERTHNIYFRDDIPGLEANDPALWRCTTSQRTLCADQLADSVVLRIYEWPPLVKFLAQAMDMPHLYRMEDPLARVNVMRYVEGQQLGWHFDRSEFTVTLLLQAPKSGGEFQYRRNLRTSDDPNYAGVARLLQGKDEKMRTLRLDAGSLNVFKGLNTPHRVTPIAGNRERIIAVYSFYDRPGVRFSRDESIGFYGRAN